MYASCDICQAAAEHKLDHTHETYSQDVVLATCGTMKHDMDYVQACLRCTAPLVTLISWGSCPLGRGSGRSTSPDTTSSWLLRCSLIGLYILSTCTLNSAFLALLLRLFWTGGSRLCFALLASAGQGGRLTGSSHCCVCSCLARNS